MEKYDFYELLICIFFILGMTATGVVSIFSVIMDVQWIRLWKEILVILIFLVCIYQCKYKKIPLIVVLVLFWFVFESLYNLINGISFESVAYAWKSDFLLCLFSFCMYMIFKTKKFSQLKLDFILHLIIVGGLINAIFGLVETLFFEDIMNWFGITKFGREMGVFIGTYGDILRPPGLQLGIVHYATILVFSYIIYFENVRLYRGKKRILFHCIFLIAIFSSTYFTAIIFMLIYFLLKFINFWFGDENDKYFYCLAIVVCFLLFGIMSTSFEFVNLFYEIDPTKTDASILPRIKQFVQVIDDVSSSLLSGVFGVGYGIYGSTGLESKSNLTEAIAIDSGFLYLLSNYGYTGVLFFLFIISSIIMKTIDEDYIGLKYILLYVLGIEFFLNNGFRDFPSNYILIVLIAVNELYAKTIKSN